MVLVVVVIVKEGDLMMTSKGQWSMVNWSKGKEKITKERRGRSITALVTIKHFLV